jgi:hypothetical protein
MAYSFNGTNQYFSTLTGDLFANFPITMACWFITSNITTNQGLLNICDNATGGQGIRLNAQGAVAGDPIRILSVGTATGSADTTTGFTANTWTHACGVFSSATSRTVYVNGGSPGTNTTNSSGTGENRLFQGVTRAASAFSNYFSGSLAEVGVWNAALTADEVLSLARGMSPSLIRPQNLTIYAPLVRDLIDRKSGLTITNNGGATVSNHTRIYL